MHPDIRLPDEARLTYTISHEAWYWPAIHAHERHDGEIMISVGPWEFAVRRYDLGSKHHLRVEIFDETWPAFDQIRLFFDALAAGEVGSLADVQALLDRLGAEDVTERVSPYRDQAPATTQVVLSAADLDQILSALRNRGDDVNGDPRWRELYGRLSAAADGMR